MLYILRTIDLDDRTDEDRSLEFQKFQVQYPIWKDKTFEHYIEFIKSWDEYNYTMNYEDNSYFESIETAKEYALMNMGDMNDGGVYNYVAIIAVPYGLCYATFTGVEELYLFKFNYKNDCYESIELMEDDKSKYLCSVLHYRV